MRKREIVDLEFPVHLVIHYNPVPATEEDLDEWGIGASSVLSSSLSPSDASDRLPGQCTTG